MKHDPERREFIKTLGRWTLLGILVVGGFERISLRKKNSDVCVSDGICSRCGTLKSCDHPSALSLKQSNPHY